MGQTEVELGHTVLRCCQDGLQERIYGERIFTFFEEALPSGQAVVSLSRGITIALILPAVQITCIIDDRPSHDAEPASMAQAQMKAAPQAQVHSAAVVSAVMPEAQTVSAPAVMSQVRTMMPAMMAQA